MYTQQLCADGAGSSALLFEVNTMQRKLHCMICGRNATCCAHSAACRVDLEIIWLSCSACSSVCC
jgi:hypothetical protein